MASLSKRNGVYSIMYRDINKSQRRITVGSVTATEARKYLRKIEEDLATQKLGMQVPAKIKLTEFWDEYLAYVKTNQSLKTYKQKEHAINNFKRLLNTSTLLKRITFLHEITPATIEKYKTFRLKDGVTNRTVNIDLHALSNSFKVAKEWNYIVNIKTVSKLSVQKKEARFLSIEELDELYSKASNYLKQVITLYVLSGMRANELLNLKWEHIDFTGNILKIANTDSFTTKSKKDRTIPMTRKLREVLLCLYNTYVDPASDKPSSREEYQKTYVLCHPDGSQIKCVRKAFSKLVSRANLSGVTLHTLRHTFASHCLLNGGSMLAVKELLGHSRITTTEIYTHLNQEFKAETVNKLSGLLIG